MNWNVVGSIMTALAENSGAIMSALATITVLWSRRKAKEENAAIHVLVNSQMARVTEDLHATLSKLEAVTGQAQPRESDKRL